MKHYYRIGEISKLYNIGPDSLRYYEELGILKPHRGENNYRMYHIHDLWRLNVIRDLRDLGFSMEKIKAYLDNRTLSTTEAMLQQELEIIETRMHSLTQLKKNIQERLENIRDAQEQPFGIIKEKTLLPRPCHMIHTPYRLDEEMDVLIEQLINKNKNKLYIIGNNRIGSVIPLEGAREKRHHDYTDVFILDNQGEDYLPGGLYLSVSYQGNATQNAQFIPALLEYADSHGLTPNGNILELLWTDIHQSQHEKEFVTELQIPCESIDA